MQAIILAAGMGKRLGALTQNNTKCMVKVNGVSLIERMLFQLSRLKSCKLTKIIIVIGYEGNKLRNYVSTLDIDIPVEYVENPIYESTNNIYSLWLAKEHLLQDDTLLLESDLIFDDAVVEKLLENPYPSLCLVSKYESWMDGTVVQLNSDCKIEKFIPNTEFRYEDANSYYKTVNIYKFSKSFSSSHYVPFLEAYCKALGNNEYYEQVLRVITFLDRPEIKALPLAGEPWYEIDDVQDLDIAESIFCSPSERLKRVASRKGGYWRYPGMHNYSVPTNPFFPSQRLLAEIKSNFERLICQVSSSLDVCNLLVGKLFALKKEYVCAANSTFELLDCCISLSQKKIGMLSATHAYGGKLCDCSRLVAFADSDVGYRFSVSDIMDFFADKDIDSLIIQNPGATWCKCFSLEDMLGLCQWVQAKGIRLIVDETFLDMVSNDSANSLMTNSIIESCHDLVVVKSLSDSYGVPGVNLSMLASSDENLLHTVHSRFGEVGLNSFAEFILQIFGKYEKIYKGACTQLAEERDRFIDRLKEVDFLQVLDNGGRMVLCKLLKPTSGLIVAEKLLNEYNIFVKTYNEAEGDGHISMAINTPQMNDMLIDALKSISM